MGCASQHGVADVLSDGRAVVAVSGASPVAPDWPSLGEPQGEGVTFGDGSAVFLMGEGGGKKMPGTFARLTCTSALQ